MLPESRPAGWCRRITSVAVGICILAAGLSCPGKMVAPTPPTQSSDELVVFLTGSELGSLRPCGCSGGQLGGIEKRSAVFGGVPVSRRLLVGTGSLVPSDHEQDLMKFRILFEAYDRLHYDVVHLTGRDHDIAARLGVLADPPPSFHVLPAVEKGQSAVFTKRVTVGGRDLTVNLVSFGSPSAVLHPPSFALGPSDALTVNILILDYDPELLEGYPRDLLLRSWVSPGAECVICPSNSDEPQLLSKPGEAPLVCTVGRFGRYIARLGVTVEESTSRPILHFGTIAVQEKLPDDPALVQLYRQYQQLVAQSNLLESYPRVPLGGNLAFTGSRSCQPCHAPAFDKWAASGHAHALATLKKVGSDRDPECVICHVIGLGFEGGFVNEAKTPQLADVGCENCHGPGSEHVLTAGQTRPTLRNAACTQCHTPEQSGDFAGHEEEYMKKILHWREPAAVGNVKTK